MARLVVQELEERTYRVVYKEDGNLIEVTAKSEACRHCTESHLLHVVLTDRRPPRTISIPVRDIVEVWESNGPHQEPHEYTGEKRVF